MRMTTIRSIFSQGLATRWSTDLIATEFSNMSQSLPSPHMSKILMEGPLFIKSSGDPPPVPTSLLVEIREREKTLEALRESNREIESILASLKPPHSETITLKKTLSHSFENLTREILLTLIPIDLNKFGIKINLLGIGIFYSIKLTSLSRKRKEMHITPSLLDKGKNMMENILSLLTNPLMNIIIWNVRGENNP